MGRYDRQADLIKCDMDKHIVVVGAGGIGSFTTLTLAKMGFTNISVYDFDKVEEHNLPNQFFRVTDIGKYKTEALIDLVHSFTGTEIIGYADRFIGSDVARQHPCVLIAAVDSMAVRKEIYDGWTGSRCPFLIDGRMGGDQAEVYSVTRGNEAAYEARLWDDKDTSPLPCTSKATMYNVLSIASLIANSTRLLLQDEPVPPAVILDNKNISMYCLK